jgi:hypothetical protein
MEVFLARMSTVYPYIWRRNDVAKGMTAKMSGKISVYIYRVQCIQIRMFIEIKNQNSM